MTKSESKKHSDTNNYNSLLNQALDWWKRGDWHSLTNLGIEVDFTPSERRELTLLRLAGIQQSSASDKIKDGFLACIEAGCSAREVRSVLLSGCYLILGRATSLSGGNDDISRACFQQAWALLRPGADVHFSTHRIRFHSLCDLSLLQQAAEEVSTIFDTLTRETPALDQGLSDLIVILRSEIETVNHELKLAHGKNQLFGSNSVINVGMPGVNPNELSKMSPSQLGQDLWVLKKCGYKTGGYFVEFGATDGILLSNTYLLEKAFAWNGICSEPNPDYFEELQRNRNCNIDNACISASTGESVQFVLANEYGGIAGFGDLDQHSDKRTAYQHQSRTLTMTTISLHDFLIKHNAPQSIDYISIDTEGNEYEILRNFPFSQWQVQYFTIEHNNTELRGKIFNLMKKNGYRRTEARWDDWYERTGIIE